MSGYSVAGFSPLLLGQADSICPWGFLGEASVQPEMPAPVVLTIQVQEDLELHIVKGKNIFIKAMRIHTEPCGFQHVNIWQRRKEERETEEEPQ